MHLFEVKAVPAVLAFRLMRIFLLSYAHLLIIMFFFLCFTLFIFRNGVVVDKFIGLVDANMIEELIEKLLRKKRL